MAWVADSGYVGGSSDIIRLRASALAALLLRALSTGVMSRGLAAAILSEAGSPVAARAIGDALRDVCGELAGLLGDVAPVVATGDEDLQLRTTEAER